MEDNALASCAPPKIEFPISYGKIVTTFKRMEYAAELAIFLNIDGQDFDKNFLYFPPNWNPSTDPPSSTGTNSENYSITSYDAYYDDVTQRTIYHLDLTIFLNNSNKTNYVVLDPNEKAPTISKNHDHRYNWWLISSVCKNNRTVTTSTTSPNVDNYITLSGGNGPNASGYINFYGIGDLSLSTITTIVSSGIIGVKKHDDSWENTTINSTTSATTQTITISPSTHKYEDIGNGQYAVTLNLTNTKISDPAFIDSLPSPYYKILNYPNAIEYSRSVNFSRNYGGKPVCATGVAFGSEFDGSGASFGLTYDYDLGYWRPYCNYKNLSYPNRFYNYQIAGDFFAIMDDVGTSAPYMRWGTSDYQYCPGLNKRFWKNDARSSPACYEFDLHYPESANAKAKMIVGGFTWPINSVLLLNEWQTIGGNTTDVQLATSPNAACRTVTTAVCNKLKENANLRVYIIKYRGQTNAKDAARNIVSHDYGYIKSCASGITTPYWQEATTEAQLKTALDAIAADIKSFAGHQEAQNVE
ncbi:MAG: hypothetical protein LBS23_02520 [Holosporaceae bacterium]|jgi:hypothetical protein|nr:hypothetical protein [Holosporaceae bacterium]